jgi:hypothetical protein
MLRTLPEQFNSTRPLVASKWNLDCNEDGQEHSAGTNSNPAPVCASVHKNGSIWEQERIDN